MFLREDVDDMSWWTKQDQTRTEWEDLKGWACRLRACIWEMFDESVREHDLRIGGISIFSVYIITCRLTALACQPNAFRLLQCLFLGLRCMFLSFVASQSKFSACPPDQTTAQMAMKLGGVRR